MEKLEVLNDIRRIILDTRKYISIWVNYAQIVSNWIVGMRIVIDEQNGEFSAEYGKRQIQFLSEHLTKEFGTGYSTSNLWYFRQFYLQYPILHTESGDLDAIFSNILHAVSGEFNGTSSKENLMGPMTSQNHSLNEILRMNLNWTHHRLLLKIENPVIRKFYLKEANENNWSTRALHRQINSFYYERLISSQNKELIKGEAEEKTRAYK
jgi:hypothetical protein